MLFIVYVQIAFAGDHAKEPAALDVIAQVGADVVMSVPEVETGAALHGVVAYLFTDHVGLSGSARGMMESEVYYGEVYFGPTFRFDQLVLTPSIGVETSAMPVRVAGSIDWRSDHVHTLGVVEYGGSGVWYHGLASVWFNPVGVGVFAQRFDGIGPWLGVEIHHFEIWTAGLYDYEDARMGAIAGLDWHL